MYLDHIESCSHCQVLLDSKIAKSGKTFFSNATFEPPKPLPFPPGEHSLAEEFLEHSLSDIEFSRLLESLFGQQFQNPKRALIQSQFLAFECIDSISNESVLGWCLRPEWATLSDLTQSLTERAHQASLVSHPSLAKIKKWSPSPLGPIVITAIPGGQNLSQTWKKVTFSSVETGAIILQLLGGLEALHKKGIVLGPIPLGDIFIDTNPTRPLGQIKACWANVVFRHGLGLPGMTVASKAFQSPEQALGKTPDFRSDFFCLGSVIFSMLTGEKAWPETPEHPQHPKPIQAHQLTSPWRNILQQLWELSPERRLADHQILAKLLTKITLSET